MNGVVLHDVTPVSRHKEGNGADRKFKVESELFKTLLGGVCKMNFLK